MPSQPIEFQTPPADVPAILLPTCGTVFAERAERFATLASGHSLGDWLNFLAQLTQAQHVALKALGPLELPDSSALTQARAHRMPPLNSSAHGRPPVWREVFINLLDDLEPHAPALARNSLMALRDAPVERLERMAEALLNGEPGPGDIAALPFVAAALQVVWTALASQLEPSSLAALDTPGVCPCCGSLPVASIVRMSPGVNNLRYLHCSLCNCEWNLARATCSVCGTDRDVAYQQIEGGNGAVRVEICDGCRSYLKIVYQEKDFRVDPVADDLATLALDMLVDEAGYSRSGPNFLLLGGAG